MNTFEYKQGKLHHYRDSELVAVIAAENVADYQKFVPEAPLPEVPADETQAG